MFSIEGLQGEFFHKRALREVLKLKSFKGSFSIEGLLGEFFIEELQRVLSIEELRAIFPKELKRYFFPKKSYSGGVFLYKGFNLSFSLEGLQR